MSKNATPATTANDEKPNIADFIPPRAVEEEDDLPRFKTADLLDKIIVVRESSEFTYNDKQLTRVTFSLDGELEATGTFLAGSVQVRQLSEDMTLPVRCTIRQRRAAKSGNQYFYFDRPTAK